MLSIFYILHHCNGLQRLGGNFPHHTLVRWGCALTCLLQTIWYIMYSLHERLRALGCSAKQQDGSISPPHHQCSASPAQWEGWQGIALVADHLIKQFPVIQRRPELPFPLHSIPGIASKAPGAGDNTSTAKHSLGSAPRLAVHRTAPQPEPSPGHVCAGGSLSKHSLSQIPA